ncbi:MAG: carbohydrate ABC transporter permease, partial [SAR324 cluster bacterium]|nr:carbohydrate ABC transporter permease [SAR324 cluster bacterium]
GSRGDFFATFFNSVWISIAASLIAVVFGSMAAYALVRFQFRVKLLAGIVFASCGMGSYLLAKEIFDWKDTTSMGFAFLCALILSVISNRLPLPGPVLKNNDVVFWFVSQRMMPPIVSAFALYMLYSKIGKDSGIRLLDSFAGLTLCYVAFSLPLVVWLMRDFFESLPVEVEEAALVDDVPRWRIFLEIVIPMAKPGLVAVTMITIGFVWNEFLFALILTTGDWQTLPVLLSGQNSYRGDEWWAIAVANIIAIAPMLIITILLGRMMRSGLMLGSIR